MEVLDILKEQDQKIVSEEVIAPSIDKDAWAKKYFSAESFDHFMHYYIKESKDIIRSYNNFIRNYGKQSLPESTQETLNNIKKSIKFAQAYYRSYNLNESNVELNADVQVALRQTWGNYPMFTDFLSTLNKDYARVVR